MHGNIPALPCPFRFGLAGTEAAVRPRPATGHRVRFEREFPPGDGRLHRGFPVYIFECTRVCSRRITFHATTDESRGWIPRNEAVLHGFVKSFVAIVMPAVCACVCKRSRVCLAVDVTALKLGGAAAGCMTEAWVALRAFSQRRPRRKALHRTDSHGKSGGVKTGRKSSRLATVYRAI